MNQMNKWIHLDETKYGEINKQKDGVFALAVRVSPYNIPEAVRAYRNESGMRCIQFRYLSGSDEPTRSFEENGVKFHIGRTSYRIYKIELPGEQELELRFIIETLEQFSESLQRPPGFGFYGVNKRVLQDPNVSSELLQIN